MELRFHTAAEYQRLSAAQKAELYKWRSEKKKRKSSSDNSGAKSGTPQPPGEGKSKAALKRRKISAMQSEMDSLKEVVSKLSVSNDSSEEKKEDVPTKNRVLFKPSGLAK